MGESSLSHVPDLRAVSPGGFVGKSDPLDVW